jgi:hypothetical protein
VLDLVDQVTLADAYTRDTEFLVDLGEVEDLEICLAEVEILKGYTYADAVTGWSRSLHDLSWAAGIYEGEGGVYVRSSLQLIVSQKDPEILHWFIDAVGAGKIYEVKHQTGEHGQMYRATISKTNEVLRVINLLWPWLSTRRKQQANEAVRKWEERPQTYNTKARSEAQKAWRLKKKQREGVDEILDARRAARR